MALKIKTITYQRVQGTLPFQGRACLHFVKNLGNYESERMEISAEINDDDDVETAIELLKTKVHHALNLNSEERVSDTVPF
jgi:hypothetical protein